MPNSTRDCVKKEGRCSLFKIQGNYLSKRLTNVSQSAQSHWQKVPETRLESALLLSESEFKKKKYSLRILLCRPSEVFLNQFQKLKSINTNIPTSLFLHILDGNFSASQDFYPQLRVLRTPQGILSLHQGPWGEAAGLFKKTLCFKQGILLQLNSD